MKILNIKNATTLKKFFFSSVLLITLSCDENQISSPQEEEITSNQDLLSITSSLSSTVNSTSHKEHDFDDSSLTPFSEDQGVTDISGEGMSFTNDGRGGKRLKLTWKESEYDGTRRERGHEIKLNVATNKELYTGWYMNVPSSGNNLLNKNTIIWQLYNWNSDGCSNWTAHLELVGSDMYLSYRAACVTPTVVRVFQNVETGRDYAIQVRCVLSGNNNGSITVYVDGAQKKSRTGINLGFGSFNSNDEAETSVVGIKMGMYCYDTGNYTDNETRILYLDNVGVTTRDGSVSNSLNKIDPNNM